MNKEEVKFDHFKDIEELIKHLEMWYAEDDYFAFDRYFHLRDARIMGMFIYELQQENKQLKEKCEKQQFAIVENCDLRLEVLKYKEVIEEVRESIEDYQEYVDEAKEFYSDLDDDDVVKVSNLQLLNNQMVRNYDLLQILDKVKENK